MTLSLLLYCLLLFCITYFSIKKFIKIAPSLGLMDIPNHRKLHTKETPRGAGIVFGFIFILGILIYDIKEFGEFKFILLSFFIIYLGGILDDLFTLSSSRKLFVTIIAASVAYFSGYQLDYIGTFLDIDFALGYLSFIGTIFVIVSLTNALNLSDGLDGLAASLSIIILSTLLIIGLIHDDHILILWPTLLIFVLLAFLIFNWYPAQVFMGDSGSLLLGFVISILSIHAIEYINPISILFLTAIPVLDTMIVFRRRIQRGKSPFIADRNHLHHILDDIKRDKAFTVKMLLLVQFSFCIIFLQIYKENEILNLLTFISLFLVFFNLFDPRSKKRNRNSRLKKKYQKEKNIKEEGNI